MNKVNIEWKIKYHAITGETRQETIERLTKGKTKLGKFLKVGLNSNKML